MPLDKSLKSSRLETSKFSISNITNNVNSSIKNLEKKIKNQPIHYPTDDDIKILKESLTKLNNKKKSNKEKKLLNLIDKIEQTLNVYEQQTRPNKYGQFALPIRGMVNAFTDGTPRGAHYLKYPSSTNLKKNNCNIVNVPVNYHSFGKIAWYPGIDIDNTYSTYSGGYSYPNGGLGPYSAVGLGNYPSKMFAEANRLNLN